MRRIQKVLGLLVLMVIGLTTVRATTFLRFESTYLGDGWFRYHLIVMNDPFFDGVDISTFEFNFNNQIDRVEAPQWTNSWFTNGLSMWSMTDGITNRPWERTFLIRSSQTNFHLLLNTNRAVFMGVNLTLNPLNPMGGGTYNSSILGITTIPCLTPCSAAEADGAPTNFVYDVKFLPDVQINQLLQADGQIYGIDFTWGYQSTFLLQGSSDCINWNDLDYVWSYPTDTEWDSPDGPLNDAGPFFRLELVSDGHVVIPMLSSPAPHATTKTVASTTASVTGSRIVDGKIIVTVSSSSDQSCQVQALDSRGTVVQTQAVTWKDAAGTAAFNLADLPTPVFFRAIAQ